MNEQKVYPESVEQQLDTLMSVIEKTQLIQEYDYPETLRYYLREGFGEFLFDKWVDGVDEVYIGEDLVIEVLKKAEAKATLHKLQNESYIDTIDDGEGNEYVFLTDKGKEALKNQDKGPLKHMSNDRVV